jgi:hypothetical protein
MYVPPDCSLDIPSLKRNFRYRGSIIELRGQSELGEFYMQSFTRRATDRNANSLDSSLRPWPTLSRLAFILVF